MGSLGHFERVKEQGGKGKQKLRPLFEGGGRGWVLSLTCSGHFWGQQRDSKETTIERSREMGGKSRKLTGHWKSGRRGGGKAKHNNLRKKKRWGHDEYANKLPLRHGNGCLAKHGFNGKKTYNWAE